MIVTHRVVGVMGLPKRRLAEAERLPHPIIAFAAIGIAEPTRNLAMDILQVGLEQLPRTMTCATY